MAVHPPELIPQHIEVFLGMIAATSTFLNLSCTPRRTCRRTNCLHLRSKLTYTTLPTCTLPCGTPAHTTLPPKITVPASHHPTTSLTAISNASQVQPDGILKSRYSSFCKLFVHITGTGGCIHRVTKSGSMHRTSGPQRGTAGHCS